MWQVLEKLSEPVRLYGTAWGKLWYMCVFVYRLIVVVTIGGPVYGDEQSNFKCSTTETGCNNACFSDFSKISHIRFWAFQLLAVTTPCVLFHFYFTVVVGRLELDGGSNVTGTGSVSKSTSATDTTDHNIRTRRNRRNLKTKRVYTENGPKEIPHSTKIRMAYFLSVAGRLVVEVVFLIIAYHLFAFSDGIEPEASNPFVRLFFLKVPDVYVCRSTSVAVETACYQHLLSRNGHVPCWVSRAWEKTILIRYMNIFSGICILLCLCELACLASKGCQRNRSATHHHMPNVESNATLRSPDRDSGLYSPIATLVDVSDFEGIPNRRSTARSSCM